MPLKDLFKQAIKITYQMVCILGFIAFIYYLTPYSEKRMDIVVVDKYYVVADRHLPNRLEICEDKSIINCRTMYTSHRWWQNTDVGEKFTMMVGVGDSLHPDSNKMVWALILAGLCVWNICWYFIKRTIKNE